MISSRTEYEKAREELDHLNRWLASLEAKQGADRRPLSIASVRKMICRVQEELAEYEATLTAASPASETSSESSPADAKRPTEDQA